MGKQTGKAKTTFRSLDDFLEPDTTELVIADATDDLPAVVIKGYTKASGKWLSLLARYKEHETLVITKDQEVLMDRNISLGMKKALAGLITEISGLSAEPITDPKEIADLMLNPRARSIVQAWNNHLLVLGNDLIVDSE